MEKIKEIYSKNEKKLTSLTKEIFTIVYGKGEVPAKLVIVLESPDESVEKDGLRVSASFEIAAKKALELAGLDRDSLYFTYAVKFCPYDISRRGKIKYRDVNDKDIELFSAFLREELEYACESLVVCIGESAKKTALFSIEEKDGEYRLDNYSKLISFETEEDFIKNIDFISDALSQMRDDDLLNESLKAREAEINTVISSVKKLDSEEVDEKSVGDYEVEAWNDFNKMLNSRSANKDVVLLYAGSNLKNDASKSIMDSMAEVFNELNMNVIMLNAYDRDFSTDLFLDSLNSAAGFVIGTSVDWYGTGHKLQELLDELYYGGRSDLLRAMPTMIVTISRNAYEDEGMNFVKNSLEILGATVVDTLTGAIENSIYYDTNKSYQKIVETKTEDFYRHIKKGVSRLPSSLNSRRVYIKVSGANLSDEGLQKADKPKDKKKKSVNTYNEFLETQKRDIDELSEIFMEKMNVSSKGKSYKEVFLDSFIKGSKFEKSKICFDIEDNKSENFNILIDKNLIKALPFNNVDCDVIISLTQKNMNNIINKKVTMQKSFLTGEVKVKGNFALLYKMDGIFEF